MIQQHADIPSENYTPGYSANASNFMANRRADTHAAFFLPYLRPGIDLLDCGCGPGTITAGLAEAVNPGGVVGIDVAGSQIALANANAAELGIKNVDFKVGSIYEIPFEDRTFGAVFSHAVMEHLSTPVKAFTEIRRVLRPDGVAGISSPDWGAFIIAPTDPMLESAISFYKELQQQNGGDPDVGRKLGALAHEGGFSRIKMLAYYECYESLEAIAEYLALRIEAVASSEPVAEMAQALRTWSKRPDGLFAQAWVAVIAWAD
jgi:ubiquinone/menaquinone biosynthesis C-methylase UbiE